MAESTSRKNSPNHKFPQSHRTVFQKPVSNTLLAQIPESEFLALQPHLEFLELRDGERLERAGEPVRAAYFLNSGLTSMIVEIFDGRSVEVGVAGRETMIGLPLAGGLQDFNYSLFVQVPGDAFFVQTQTLTRLLPSLPELHRLLLRRLAIRSIELAQNAACNRLHNVRQRLARWLLITHDRLESNVIATTHGILSGMLGTDRPTVTVTLREFESDGAVRIGRAAISIENRRKLEKHSCECYGVFWRFNPELGLNKY